MIRRLLVANRGEIAVRIAATAHRLGIGTVGVYSEPDANALHVDVMDSAVSLGGSSPADSYLRAEAIVDVALQTGCDALHPGYGFLAENDGFAQMVIDAGITWVGPSPEQIGLLGDKMAAKKAAIAAGVPTAPVYEAAPGIIPDGLPMPAMVKAAAGGGGRGMRVVERYEELGDAIAEAAREAESAFGDGRVFIEPYIRSGRHVEVQIVGDMHGNVIHLGERECSIQRRNQKLIEESPSCGIDPETRSRLWEGALALARHVGHVNAGTVEFMVGDDGTIDLLEVNTRLQVEHPVTELTTGVDLVELQLRVAAGEALPIRQEDATIEGHAIEARVVAEDPSAGWLPSMGLVDAFAIDGDVRVDTAIRVGTEISPDYDSLVAKVVAHAPTREEAALRLARVLRRAEIGGVTTNLGTLAAILGSEDFLAARTPTSFLDEHPELVAAPGPIGDDRVALLLGAVFTVEMARRAADPVTGFAPSGWRNLRTAGQRQTWLLNGDDHHVEYVMDDPTSARVWLGHPPAPSEDGSLSTERRRIVAVRLLDRSFHRQVVEIDGRRTAVDVALDGDLAHTRSPAGALTWVRVPRFVVHEADEAGSGPVCPLPGTVIAVHTEPCEHVGDGDLLMVIEAMKMEHKITASGPATVAEVRFSVGDRVDIGDLLVRLETPS